MFTDDNVRVPVRYNNQPSFVKMPQKQVRDI